MRTYLQCLLLLLVAVGLLAGCQAGAKGGGYGMFYTPADHVDELLKQNKIREASRVYNENPGFFASTDPDAASVRDRLAQAVLGKVEPEVRSALEALDAVAWPARPADWPAVKKALVNARDVIDSLRGYKILDRPEYRIAEAGDLSKKMVDLQTRITADAPDMLADYPVTTSKDNFFEVYPAKLNPSKAFGNATAFWTDRLEDASADQVKQVMEIYGSYLDEAALEAAGAAYYRRMVEQEQKGGEPSLNAVMAAVAATHKAGLPLKETPGVKVVFVNITSKQLPQKGLLDFPVAIDNDTPFSTEREDMRRLFATGASLDADVYILVDLAMTKSERDIYSKKNYVSEYLSGIRKVENRAYIDIKDKVDRLRQRYDSLGLQSTLMADPFAASLGYWAQADVGGDMEEAEEELKKTPRYLEEEVYTEYPYRVFDMDVMKLATVNYYIIDRRSKRFFKDTFDVRQKQAFSIPYGLHHKDPHVNDIMVNRDVEEDVNDFEDAPVTVPLTAILEQFTSQPEKGVRLKSMASLADDILEQRNQDLEKLKKAKVFTADVSHDERFQAVAYISLPRSLGSGFYVRDDIIMTNFHVVEESDFVEIRLYDGTETFGKVIAKDIHRDLALIKVQARRKPVKFYHENSIPLGATVEVIGNPEGFKFSITRGIISAVREWSSLMGMEDKNVLFLQVDAAINHGNSGGPVFMGDSVVAVVDWGKGADIAEGLNFCIHYSEVLEFMRKNGVEPILADKEDTHAQK